MRFANLINMFSWPIPEMCWDKLNDRVLSAVVYSHLCAPPISGSQPIRGSGNDDKLVYHRNKRPVRGVSPTCWCPTILHQARGQHHQGTREHLGIYGMYSDVYAWAWIVAFKLHLQEHVSAINHTHTFTHNVDLCASCEKQQRTNGRHAASGGHLEIYPDKWFGLI